MLYILTFQVLSSIFFLNFLLCPGFLTFLDKFQTISGPGQRNFKSPGFPGFQVPLGTLIYTHLDTFTVPQKTQGSAMIHDECYCLLCMFMTSHNVTAANVISLSLTMLYRSFSSLSLLHPGIMRQNSSVSLYSLGNYCPLGIFSVLPGRE